MRLFGYPYNDLVICKDSPDYLKESINLMSRLYNCIYSGVDPLTQRNWSNEGCSSRKK